MFVCGFTENREEPPFIAIAPTTLFVSELITVTFDGPGTYILSVRSSAATPRKSEFGFPIVMLSAVMTPIDGVPNSVTVVVLWLRLVVVLVAVEVLVDVTVAVAVAVEVLVDVAVEVTAWMSV